MHLYLFRQDSAFWVILVEFTEFVAENFVEVITIVIAVIALGVSAWARIEMHRIGKREQRLSQTKRIGESLVASQELKNELSDCIDSAENWLEELKAYSYDNNSQIRAMNLKPRIKKLKTEYDEISEDVKSFEQLVIEIEKGNKLHFDPVKMEARIAHLTQRRALAKFDIRYIDIQLGN